ncbi:MAG: hypothetical protein CL917_04450 [Deltaproteobacteria bacterium]|nr:hypothetical protein [Deltaproteobacteria bacterium]
MPFYRWEKSSLGTPESAVGLMGLGLTLNLCVVGVMSLVLWAATSTAQPVDAQSAPASAQEPFLGRWYVLVHLDPESDLDPAEPRWEDQIWEIESVGKSFRWTLFPHVEFKRNEGRYESREDGLRARSPGVWSPSADQIAEIKAGLKVDSYSARSKSLRGSPSKGWQSAGALRSGSASMVGYHELWEIRLRDGFPVFSRSDRMGSARTEVLEATTRFSTDQIDTNGHRMSGTYQKGTDFKGQFWMTRMDVGAGQGDAP